MHVKNEALKRLAMQAKRRLKGEKVEIYEKNKDNKIKIISNEEDEILYQKVCALLTENRDMINPIGRLIETYQDFYNSLQASTREKYFFNLVDKYGECKARFDREHNYTA